MWITRPAVSCSLHPASKPQSKIMSGILTRSEDVRLTGAHSSKAARALHRAAFDTNCRTGSGSIHRHNNECRRVLFHAPRERQLVRGLGVVRTWSAPSSMMRRRRRSRPPRRPSARGAKSAHTASDDPLKMSDKPPRQRTHSMRSAGYAPPGLKTA